ncbi:hypothetical protein C0995_006470 [Termitomyces sp. Mi166|nr:hypothetical protein C0995_006470 [Termitomyces sp. Mi166\
MVVDLLWFGGLVLLSSLVLADDLISIPRLLKWLIASIFDLTIGISMGELASAAPTSGGSVLTAMATAPLLDCRMFVIHFPFSLSKLALSQNANTVGSIAAVSSINWGCALQVMAAIIIGSGGTFEPTSVQTFGVYVAIVLIHIVICCLGTDVLARAQGVYTVLNLLLCLAVVIALPVSTPTKYMNTAKFALWDFTNFNGWPNGFAFLLSFNAPLWTINWLRTGGYDACVHISEEASNAATAVPWAITMAIAIGGIVGWAINMSLAFCMGTDLQALNDSSQPMAQIFFQSFGQKATLVIWACIVVVQFMMGSSMLLAASRQTFAFSRDSALPFSSWLYRMNGYTKTPVNTVVFDGLLAIALGCLVFAGEQAINAAFAISIVGNYIAYAIPICARFMGENDFKPGPFTLGAFSRPIATIAVVFMFFMSIVIFFPTTPTTDAANMNYTVVLLGGILALSILWFYFPRYGGVYWFTGPMANIDNTASESAYTIGLDLSPSETLTVENFRS